MRVFLFAVLLPVPLLIVQGQDLDQIRRAAEQGSVRAQFQLGAIYDSGWGEPEDGYQAAKLYLAAAERGNTTAQYHLGHSYAFGEGVRQDTGEAFKWLRLSAEQGHVRA